MDLMLERFRQLFEKFWTNGWLCILVAVILLGYGIFNAAQKNTSAGIWILILIGSVLIINGLGQLTGLGFSMSF